MERQLSQLMTTEDATEESVRIIDRRDSDCCSLGYKIHGTGTGQTNPEYLSIKHSF
jgi:hypothetical protein